MTFWKDPRDSSSWRKVGLAIRMAYELNLHAAREDPLSSDELSAREQLVGLVFGSFRSILIWAGDGVE